MSSSKNKGGTYFLTERFLSDLFVGLYSHMSKSFYYEKYVIVEPVFYINLKGNVLKRAIGLEKVLYNSQNFGEEVARMLDSAATEHIQQQIIMENQYILICDNPLIGPKNRVKDFLKFLTNNRKYIKRTDGLIHYHINEPNLSYSDIQSLKQFSKRMIELGGRPQLGLVISQPDPIKNFEFVNHNNKDVFISYMFSQFEEGNIHLSGAQFAQENEYPVKLVPPK